MPIFKNLCKVMTACLLCFGATEAKAEIVFDAIFDDFKIKVSMDFEKKKVCFSKRTPAKAAPAISPRKVEGAVDTYVTDAKGRLWMLFTLLESERDIWGVVKLTSGETGVIIGTNQGGPSLPAPSAQSDEYDGPYPSLNDGMHSHVHGIRAGRQINTAVMESIPYRMDALEARLDALKEELEKQERLGESEVEETPKTDETSSSTEAESDDSAEGECTEMAEAEGT